MNLHQYESLSFCEPLNGLAMVLARSRVIQAAWECKQYTILLHPGTLWQRAMLAITRLWQVQQLFSVGLQGKSSGGIYVIYIVGTQYSLFSCTLWSRRNNAHHPVLCSSAQALVVRRIRVHISIDILSTLRSWIFICHVREQAIHLQWSRGMVSKSSTECGGRTSFMCKKSGPQWGNAVSKVENWSIHSKSAFLAHSLLAFPVSYSTSPSPFFILRILRSIV